MPQYITVTDFIFLPFTLLIVFRLAVYLRNRHFHKDHSLRPYFVPALMLKVFGAIAFAMVYKFYYKFGDTFRFYDMGTFMTNILKDDPLTFIKVYFTGGDDFFVPRSFVHNFDYLYNRYLPNLITGRFSSFFGLFLFNNFLLITIAFSLVSFSGLWKLFRMFTTLYPHLVKPLAFCILFLPSGIFWSSGILKDSLAIGAIGWLTFSLWKIFYLKKDVISASLIVVFSGTLIYTLKSYILVCYIPAMGIWIGSHFYTRIKSQEIRKLVWVGVIGALIFMSTRAEELVEAQSRQIQELARSALLVSSLLEGYEAGSTYNLGVSTGSAASIVKSAPMAIVTSLYRPFLWEVRNPIMLFSALESLLILLVTLYVFLKAGVIRTFKLIFTKGIIFFCLMFSFTFSFGVALSSNNFGTLVRYKIPAIPFYMIAILLIYYYSGNKLPVKLMTKSFQKKARAKHLSFAQ